MVKKAYFYTFVAMLIIQNVTASFESELVSFQLISRLCYCKLDLPFLLRLTYFCFL